MAIGIAVGHVKDCKGGRLLKKKKELLLIFYLCDSLLSGGWNK